MSGWHWRDYLKHRSNFVAARHEKTSIAGMALVFACTLLAGWLCSWLLLRFAHVHSMGLRYALGAVFAYGVFFLAIRIWAEFQHPEPDARESGYWDIGGLELPPDVDSAAGCLLVIFAAIVGFVCAGLVWAFGGFAVFLEVAFEVAFAGVVVRRALRPGFIVGNWWRVLWQRTWLPALLVAGTFTVAAVLIQREIPQARTLAEAFIAWHRSAAVR